MLRTLVQPFSCRTAARKPFARHRVADTFSLLEGRLAPPIFVWYGNTAGQIWSNPASWREAPNLDDPATRPPGPDDEVVFLRWSDTTLNSSVVDAAFGGVVNKMRVQLDYTSTITLTAP